MLTTHTLQVDKHFYDSVQVIKHVRKRDEHWQPGTSLSGGKTTDFVDISFTQGASTMNMPEDPMTPGELLAPLPKRPLPRRVGLAPVGTLDAVASQEANAGGRSANGTTAAAAAPTKRSPGFLMSAEAVRFYAANSPVDEDGWEYSPPPGWPERLPPMADKPPHRYDPVLGKESAAELLSMNEEEYLCRQNVVSAGMCSPRLSASFDPAMQPESVRQIKTSCIEISYVLFTFIEPKNRKEKPYWSPMKRKGIRLPPDTVLRGLDLQTFKKIVAGCCFVDDQPQLPLGNTILQLDIEKKVEWTFVINGSDEFPAAARVSINNDDHFCKWLLACSGAGRRAIGVKISMADPTKHAKNKRKRSDVARSIKRSNRAYRGSDSEGSSDTDASSGSVHTLAEDDDEQRLENTCVQIRKGLLASSPASGEVALYRDKTDPKRFVRVTPALLRLWATDLIAKIPGVDIDTPPNRPAFKTKTKREWAALAGPDPISSLLNAPQAGKHTHDDPTVLAHSINRPFSDFLHFAHIRSDVLLVQTKEALEGLGIDHWSIFASDFDQAELLRAGMAIGTIRKLFNAAKHYPKWLISEASKM